MLAEWVEYAFQRHELELSGFTALKQSDACTFPLHDRELAS